MRWLSLLVALSCAGCCLGPDRVIEAPPQNVAPPPPPPPQYEPPPPPPAYGQVPPPPTYSAEPTCNFEAGRRQGEADGSRRSEVSWGAASCAANAVFPMLCFGVEMANDHVPVYVPQHQVCGPGYEDGYRNGYAHAVRNKRDDAMLWGGIAGAALWGIGLILVLTTPGGSGSHSSSFNDARRPPTIGMPIGRF